MHNTSQGVTYKTCSFFAEDNTLVISDTEIGDSGKYMCHVQNEYGTADSSTVISIKGTVYLFLKFCLSELMGIKSLPDIKAKYGDRK